MDAMIVWMQLAGDLLVTKHLNDTDINLLVANIQVSASSGIDEALTSLRRIPGRQERADTDRCSAAPCDLTHWDLNATCTSTGWPTCRPSPEPLYMGDTSKNNLTISVALRLGRNYADIRTQFRRAASARMLCFSGRGTAMGYLSVCSRIEALGCLATSDVR